MKGCHIFTLLHFSLHIQEEGSYIQFRYKMPQQRIVMTVCEVFDAKLIRRYSPAAFSGLIVMFHLNNDSKLLLIKCCFRDVVSASTLHPGGIMIHLHKKLAASIHSPSGLTITSSPHSFTHITLVMSAQLGGRGQCQVSPVPGASVVSAAAAGAELISQCTRQVAQTCALTADTRWRRRTLRESPSRQNILLS